ncbi:Peptidase M12A and Metridin ShK toxin domain containing protein [Aphelenchoides besseyi]|nr:Peptidase M12A and Metridin ShK toxin domain containing protein [Aphelenchoides besseyi]
MPAGLLNVRDELFRDAIPVEEVNHYKTDIRGPYANQRRVKRNGVSRTTKLWPQGRIPYAISPHYSTHERALLARAVKQYHDKTCVRFVPRSSGEGDYLFIGKMFFGGWTYERCTGVVTGQWLYGISDDYSRERWDRDTFIDIIWQNIDRGALDQFGKVDLSKTSYYGQPYDYRSILHYDSLAFSKNGFPTMLPKKSRDVDLAKINRMYKCDQRKPVNTIFIPAKAQVAPIYAPPFYKGYNRPAIDGHYPFFEPTKTTPPKPICEDRITVCWWTQDRCLSPNIYVMMRNLCAKTCGFC